MPKISEALATLGVDKQQLSDAYMTLFWKKITSQVSQANMKILQDHFSAGSHSSDVKRSSKTVNKAIKADELSSDSFLSGLWFSQPKESNDSSDDEVVFEKAVVVKKQSEVVDVVSDHKTEKGEVKEAVVIRKSETPIVKQSTQSSVPEKKFVFKKYSAESKSSSSSEQKNSQGIRYFDTAQSKNTFAPKSHVQFQRGVAKTPVVKQEKQEKEVKEAKTSSTLVKKSEIIIGSTINVKEFSEKMWVPIADLIKKLLANKIVAGVNTSIDYDTAALIALEFDIAVKKESTKVSFDDLAGGNLQSILDIDKDSDNLQERSPIVTIMGHVDHWKTSLLDYMRKTVVAKWEVWWITQSIWASAIVHDGKKITFIDTPGHELFTAIRARWAKVTNIVVIVIAADDGIKQQTVEAINHAKEAWVSIIVAITKIDKPSADIERIKTQVTEQGLIPEERWGDVPIVPLSSMTGQWVDLLLDTILLKAHDLKLRYNPWREAVCVVLESNRDAKQGVTTSLIVMTGTLKIWDILVIHDTYGKVRRILDWKGKEVREATGWEPVMILWIPNVVEPGRVWEVVAHEKIASAKVQEMKQQTAATSSENALMNFLARANQWDVAQLKLVLRADLRGSLEALKQAVAHIVPPENIEIKIIHSDVGSFTESDLSLWQAAGAVLLWFGVSINSALKKKAEQLKITVKNFDIIYELIDYVESVVTWMIKVEAKELYLGRLSVLGIFFKREKEMIIWGKVIDGKVTNGAQFRVHRGEEMVATGRVLSLKKETENVDEVPQGYECGMKVKVAKKIVEGDELEFFVME